MVLIFLLLKSILNKERLNIEAQSTEINKFFHNSRNFKIIKGYKNG